MWISKRAAPQNKKIIISPQQTLRGPTLSACAIHWLIKLGDNFSDRKYSVQKGKKQTSSNKLTEV